MPEKRPFALVAILGVACVQTSSPHELQSTVEVVRHQDQLTLATIVALVRNATSERTIVEHRLDETCGTRHEPAIAARDQRFAPSVVVDLEPGTWFAHWRILSWPGTRCAIESMLNSVTKEQSIAQREMVTSIEFKAHEPHTYEEIATVPGVFTFETSIVQESIRDTGDEPTGLLLAVQVLVRNGTRDFRRVAITRVDVECAHGGDFEGIVGPGSGHQSLTSGPIDIAPNSWAVLSHRLRGNGEPERCESRLEVSEAIRDEGATLRAFHGLGVSWRPVTTIEMRLIPVVRVTYASQ